jgi:hypothetical protein
VRSAVRSIIPVLCPVMLLLCGCASDSPTTFILQNGTRPDSQQLAAANAECYRTGASVGGFITGTAGGAAGGLYAGTLYGATQGGPPGAVVLGGLGFLYGLLGGGVESIPPDHYDLCMARMGYQRVDAQQAAALAPGDPAR